MESACLPKVHYRRRFLFSPITLVAFLIACASLSLAGQLLCAQDIRIATFNTSLFRKQAGDLAQELKANGSESARKVAETLQIVRPDVILLNEFDYDASGRAVELFQRMYLERSQNRKPKIIFPYRFLPPVNTGLSSGLDLDGDGKTGGPGDAWGYGKFPGQYGFVILSRFPIDLKATRTFQKFLWRDMPDAMLPKRKDGSQYYSDTVLDSFRLSSKTHCDVVIRIKKKAIHLLASHPTPPVFDGEEDRNGRRNHDEIRFWNDYVSTVRAGYIYDDKKVKGGLGEDASFVIAGDLNADPHDGDSTGNPIKLFASNPRINFKISPRSAGALEASKSGKANQKHLGNAAMDTADFNDSTVGNLRIDYVLPSADLKVKSSGVFWPVSKSPDAGLLKVSDHRLVWIDLNLDE